MEWQERLERLPEVLLPWFDAHARALPWRRDREPYHVWVSEIMLQQTRVEAVKRYYTRFLEAFPDIPSLAGADWESVSKLWEGLGYYSRARNLQEAARQIMDRHGGAFPTDYDGILALKGVGDYTAGAIASICFGLPTPAVDGNVLRVCSRIAGDVSPVDRPETKAVLREALAEIYPRGNCGEFTQALMELGALVCVPNSAPNCDACPAAGFCYSRDGAWKLLPVRGEKRPRRLEQLTVFLFEYSGALAVRKRSEQGLLSGLWEFPNVSGSLEPEEAVSQAEAWGVCPREILLETRKTHIFTHVKWDMRGYYFSCAVSSPAFTWATGQMLDGEIALPTAFRKFREETIKINKHRMKQEDRQ